MTVKQTAVAVVVASVGLLLIKKAVTAVAGEPKSKFSGGKRCLCPDGTVINAPCGSCGKTIRRDRHYYATGANHLRKCKCVDKFGNVKGYSPRCC